nr:T-cell receptor alpha chain V region CTL-L17 precursor [Esox lucius]
MLFISSIFFLSAIGGSYEQTIEPNQQEVYVDEGSNVHLSCNYTSADYLLWYKQPPGSAPQYLLRILHSSGTEFRDDTLDLRFSGKQNEDKIRVDLEISSAEVTDSALYYCALRPDANNWKVIFGAGTKMIIETKDHSEPKYYNLNKENTNACLATEFSSHSATNKTGLPWREASRVKGDSYYSQVALINNNETCENGSPSKNGDNWPLKTDRKTNFLSLTILGLRILFLKTIIFNVLMTLRVWMS